MVTKLEHLKEWAKQNVTLIDLLPNNNGLQVTTRLIDVLEDEVDEKYYLSDEKVKKLTLNLSLTSQDKHGVAIREATKKGYAIAEQGDSVNYTYPTSKTRRGRVGKQVAQTLQAGEVNQGVVMEDKGLRFTDDGFHTHRNDEKKSSIQGTHVTYKEGKTHALTSNHVPMTLNDIRIRKLTEKECWRLQSFTDEQFYKAKESGVSNSQLYKQAGNAVTVNVVDAIVKCL